MVKDARMTTEKAPSKQASLEGQAILAYPDASIRCRRIWKGGQYVAVASLGHLQPAGSTLALCGIETGCGNYAESDALRLCRNCVEKAARPAQGKSEIRADRDALRARNVALVALADKWDFEQTTYPHADEGAAAAAAVRLCAKELRAALAADAKAGEDR